MASLIPKFVKKEVLDVWVGETWKLMLLSSSHAPNANTQQYVADVVANEITDGGGIYSPGGVAVPGKVAVADSSNYYLDASDISIGPGASLNYRYAVAYKNTGNPATSPIRAQIDFLINQIVVNGTSIIVWNTLGIIYIT
jgi:hypothetical protein